MAIDFSKPLQTRHGKEVRIYACDCGGDTPIHGVIRGKTESGGSVIGLNQVGYGQKGSRR